MKQDALVVREEFLCYANVVPEVLEICKLSMDEWTALELYQKVHLNELYALISAWDGAPENILEWGTGLSTCLFAHFCRTWHTRSFLTIDHHAEYQARTLARVDKPEGFEALSLDLAGGLWPGEDARNYATYPLSRQIKYDLIFVDGRRRNECLLVASNMLSAKGMVILHDAWRSRYEVGMGLFRKIRDLDYYTVMALP